MTRVDDLEMLGRRSAERFVEPGSANYRFSLSLASLLIAGQLADTEADEQRRARKQTVAQEKWSLLRNTFPRDLGELHGYGGTGPAVRQLTQAFEHVTRHWPLEQRWMLLIDLVMSDPFAPYGLKVTITDFRSAVATIATALDLGDEHTELLDTWNETLRSYSPSRWRTAITPNVLTPFALSTSGPDPITAARLVATAGLDATTTTASGVAHDVALLGGGSLSLGGSGLAAGMWLVTTDAATDAALPDGGIELLALGPAQARVELVKLQLNFRLVVRYERSETVTADDLAMALARIADDLQTQLELERRVNDDDAPRIIEIETILNDVHAAQRVMSDVVEEAA